MIGPFRLGQLKNFTTAVHLLLISVVIRTNASRIPKIVLFPRTIKVQGRFTQVIKHKAGVTVLRRDSIDQEPLDESIIEEDLNSCAINQLKYSLVRLVRFVYV